MIPVIDRVAGSAVNSVYISFTPVPHPPEFPAQSFRIGKIKRPDSICLEPGFVFHGRRGHHHNNATAPITKKGMTSFGVPPSK